MSPVSPVTIVGAGPNGLAAGITLAERGLDVTIVEAQPVVGGGARTLELSLPGFKHDACAAVFPMAVASPLFERLPLARFGLEWLRPEVQLAHPLHSRSSPFLCTSLETTVSGWPSDAKGYRATIGFVARRWPQLRSAILERRGIARHPLDLIRLGALTLRSARAIADSRFETAEARALFGGLAAHGLLPLDERGSAIAGVILAAIAHTHGWPIAAGGAQELSNALAAYFRELGGRIETGVSITSIDELGSRGAILCDMAPAPFVRFAGHRLPSSYRRRLERYRYGIAAFKLDWALSDPIPWTAPQCRRAGTVHIGRTFESIASAEREAWSGRLPEEPFVVLGQPSVIDNRRAPAGRHVAWAYAHVPNGCQIDLAEKLEKLIDEHAPGFRDCILARVTTTPANLEARNPNMVGGDIAAGAPTLQQLLARPTMNTHATPLPNVYICSAATPPGPGVHGMCGYNAARLVLAAHGL